METKNPLNGRVWRLGERTMMQPPKRSSRKELTGKWARYGGQESLILVRMRHIALRSVRVWFNWIWIGRKNTRWRTRRS
jgi:hypothetical protein